MSTSNAEYNALMAEFESVCAQLDEVLKDLEWRKPDVEAEEAKLEALREQAKTDPDVDVGTQVVVVRVLRGVLDDKIAEADRLEKRMQEIQAELEKMTTGVPVVGEVGESGQAVPEEEKRLG